MLNSKRNKVDPSRPRTHKGKLAKSQIAKVQEQNNRELLRAVTREQVREGRQNCIEIAQK